MTMPQAYFLNRRWRIATDSLPLLFYPLLYGLSVAMFILLLSLVALTLDGNYECSEFAKVGVAMYGMTSVYFFEIVLFILLIKLGWRGGPLNESKRMPQMSILIYLWIVVACIKLLLTAYGLFVVYSPTVSKSCWSSNPCDNFKNALPKVCVPGATGSVELTPECQIVFANSKKYDACFDSWDRYAAGWMVDNFIGKNETDSFPIFNYPGITTCRNDVDPKSDKRLEEYLTEFVGKQNIFQTLLDVSTLQSSSIGSFDAFPSEYMAATLSFISSSIAENDTSHALLMSRIPWNDCMSSKCRKLLENKCEQWEIFAGLPDTYKMSGLFSAIMYVSFAVIILTGFIFFVSFNAFPDYESEESWQGLLSGVAKRLGYMEDLSNTSTDDGVDALVGIGGLLHSLFGGADLDVSDLILGLYLVHLRQKWKRKQHALLHLAKHGYDGKEKQLNTWRSICFGFVLFPLFQDGYHTNGDRSWWQRIWKRTESDKQSTPSLPVQISSEMEQVNLEDVYQGNHEESSLTLRHSFVRMQSMSDTEEKNDDMFVCVSDTAVMRFVQQERRLITPLNLSNVTFDIGGDDPLAADDFVSMYMGSKYTLVGKQELEDVLHFLPIARASYGLMKQKWGGCKDEKWYHTYQSGLFSFCGTCIPKSVKESYHEKRNLKGILQMTNIKSEDLVYASYTSSPLGVIPYLILLDTSTKNVCISIRGTVGAADLITDLLSSPRDISTVKNNGMNDDEHLPSGGKEAYAHAGIVSSAIAVISEFKELGIWNAFAPRDPHESSTEEGLPDMTREENMIFPLPRAIALIRQAICVHGFGVIVTGHSLGAAVACIVSSSMRKIQPSLRCFAYNPPGGLFDDSLRKMSESFCTTVVCGQDAISRMSIGTMKRIIDDMMFALASCIRPKLSILFDSIIGRYVNASAATRVFGSFKDLEPDVKDVLLKYLQKSKFHQQNVDDRAMYPPGRIIFLRPYGDLTTSADVRWDAVWLQAEDLMDEGLLLSTAMFRHHLLVETKTAIEKALENLSCSPESV